MNPELDPNDFGRQLGTDGVDGVVAKAERYCVHEERRIARQNHAPVVALRAEFSLLMGEERRLSDLLASAPAPGDLRLRRGKQIIAGVVTAILIVTSFFLAALTFAPYRLGWQGYLFCLGIATVVPFLVDMLLADRRYLAVVKALTAIAAIAGVTSLMLLADVRGHLLTQQIESAPAVVIDDTQPERSTPQEDFYGTTLRSLRLATVLLSLAMELGAGLALREALAEPPHDIERWNQLRNEVAAIRRQMVRAAGQITRLEDEPAIFEARFWRDFYKSLLTHTVQHAMKKLLMLIVVALLIPHAFAAATPHLNLVIGIDLSRSVGVKGPDRTTEFEKNVDGVTHLLAQVPAGARITIIGITDRSFAQPYILLSATVPEDAGYFGERLDAARKELVRVWQQKSAKLQPSFPGTDILGALRLASQIFNTQIGGEEHKVLVLFSDMRSHTRELNLETGAKIYTAIKTQSALGQPLPDLRGVRIFALGVEGASATEAWPKLAEFWGKYLTKSGASVGAFSPLRQGLLLTTK